MFHREEAGLTKQNNMAVRRYWHPKLLIQHLEGRRGQCEQAVKDGVCLSVEDSIKCAQDIVTKNGYNFTKFVNDVLDVLYKKKNKINTLYFQGSSNSCKSTIGWSVVNITPNYSMGMSSQEFMFHNCANSSIIFFEELKITPDIVNEMKRVLEGSEICANRKNTDGHFCRGRLSSL